MRLCGAAPRRPGVPATIDGATGIAFDILSVIGIGVILGLMAFGFFGIKAARIIGVVGAVAAAPFAIGFLHQYAVLSGSLLAYSVSTLICYFLRFRNKEEFDFALLKERIEDCDHRTADDAGHITAESGRARRAERPPAK